MKQSSIDIYKGTFLEFSYSYSLFVALLDKRVPSSSIVIRALELEHDKILPSSVGKIWTRCEQT
jgi:hypothetical protein